MEPLTVLPENRFRSPWIRNPNEPESSPPGDGVLTFSMLLSTNVFDV